jgi:hypothetical protein
MIRASREVAKECSPRRKPRVEKMKVNQPRRGERKSGAAFLGLLMRHRSVEIAGILRLRRTTRCAPRPASLGMTGHVSTVAGVGAASVGMTIQILRCHRPAPLGGRMRPSLHGLLLFLVTFPCLPFFDCASTGSHAGVRGITLRSHGGRYDVHCSCHCVGRREFVCRGPVTGSPWGRRPCSWERR